MRTELYPIPTATPGKLFVMPRPRAGDWLEDEVRNWRRAGADIVVSLLDDGEVAELGLEAEPTECQRVGIDFRRFPIPDRGLPPTGPEFGDLVTALVAGLSAGRSVGLHCRIGVGRSALVAACVLVRLGQVPDASWVAIEKARGRAVPDTPEQRAWVETWVRRDAAVRAVSEQPTAESQP
jgi:protein-tyrosine phosphatase